jgi:hypothetical protein
VLQLGVNCSLEAFTGGDTHFIGSGSFYPTIFGMSHTFKFTFLPVIRTLSSMGFRVPVSWSTSPAMASVVAMRGCRPILAEEQVGVGSTVRSSLCVPD